jgi:hypothetical protein
MHLSYGIMLLRLILITFKIYKENFSTSFTIVLFSLMLYIGPIKI